MNDRKIRLGRRIAFITREVCNRELSKLSHFLSQDAWEAISTSIASSTAEESLRDFDTSAILAENEVQNAKGQLNAVAILDSIHQMRDASRKEGDKAKLDYLAQHITKVMTDLKILKPKMENRNE